MTATMTPQPARPASATHRPEPDAGPPPTGPAGRAAWIIGAAGLSLVYTVQQFRDPDVWWHLALGRIISTRGIPSSEQLSFDGAPNAWVGQQWLYELGLSRLVDLGGRGAAMLAMGLVGSLAFAIAALCLRRGERTPPAASAASLLLMGFVAGEVLGVRGQVISVLGAALTLLVVTRWRDGSTRVVWALVPLLAVWANLHAGFVVGPALALIAAAVVAGHRAAGGDETARVRPLLLAVAAGLAATLINPAGPRLWGYVAQTFANPTLTAAITEWQSPDFHSTIFRLFEGSVIALVALWAWSRRADPLDVALVVAALAATFQAQRNLALCCMIMTPQLARYGAIAWIRVRGTRRPRPVRRLPAPVALTVAAAVTLAALLEVLPMTRASSTDAYERDHLPSAAAGYVAAHLAGTRIYSTYEWGGYLAWRFGDHQRMVWIYGESAVFGDQRLQDYLQVHLLKPGWRDVLVREGMRHAVLPQDAQETAALLATGWSLLCRDPDGGAVVLEAGPLPAGPVTALPPDPGVGPTCSA